VPEVESVHLPLSFPWKIGDEILSAEIATLSIDIELNPDLQIESPPTAYVVPRKIERVGPHRRLSSREPGLGSQLNRLDFRPLLTTNESRRILATPITGVDARSR